jgi:hypothetical protein
MTPLPTPGLGPDDGEVLTRVILAGRAALGSQSQASWRDPVPRLCIMGLCGREAL